MPTKLRALAALPLLVCAACNHQVRVTPTYSPEVALQNLPRICVPGEVVAVSARNDSPDQASAGTTEAGMHTFNYRFDSDPALILKYGLEEALRRGGCAPGSAGAATLRVALARIEARGLECGFASCEGSGESVVEATLLDEQGQALLTDTLTANATTSCGLTICNGKEASELANELLSESIKSTIAGFARAITKQLEARRARPPAPAPADDALPAPTGSAVPPS